ncbi:PAS domain-containing sensor histidine kinase [Paenibacillus sp. YYML68]|uniref:PAS domain-containing sensor histidine kinase n=1 Tax=Paenibacillus sp. YYML68 TaxID=2909250 RepID=UPI0024908838|nr:PAS domain-containing sensor histidine kinase [Paenibacillus sp. YYML68]
MIDRTHPSINNGERSKQSPALERVLIELALKHFASSPNGALLLDTECNLVMAGESLCKTLGYSSEELQRMNLQTLLHPGDLLLCMHNLSQLVNGTMPQYEAELRWQRADGGTVWMSLNACGLLGNSQGPSYIYMQLQDISERKSLEDSLAEALTRMSAWIEMINDAYVMLNRKSEFIYVNRAAEQLLGYSRESLLNRGLHTILPEWINSGFYKQCERALEEAVPVHFPFYFPMLDKWLEVSSYPAKSGVSIFMRDVTKQKELHDELHMTKLQLNSLIEQAGDNISFLDTEFKVLRVNQSFQNCYGYTEAELVGKLPLVVPDDLWIESELLLRQALQGRKISSFETKRRKKSGEILDISMTISPIVGPDGDITSISIVCRDISERKRTEELLRNTEKLSVAGQLAAGIAHEIRNPLTSLKGFTQFMKTAAEYKDYYLDIMISELNRIEQIINELLMLAKPPQAATFENRPLSPIIEHVISLLESQSNLRNVEVHTSLHKTLPHVYCEENRLKQVFINVMKNAIEAMPNGGRIDISSELIEDRHLVLTFADNGPGIPPEVLQRLGEPFFTTKDSGSGLGLMISQKMIAEHGGHLDIQSELTVGTTVKIVLPIAHRGV